MKVLRDPRSKRTALFPKFEQIFGHRLWRRELLVQVQYRKLVISKISWNVRRYNTTRQLQVSFDQLHWIMGIGFREIRNLTIICFTDKWMAKVIMKRTSFLCTSQERKCFNCLFILCTTIFNVNQQWITQFGHQICLPFFQCFLYLNFNIVLYLQEVELGAALELRCIGRKSA